MILINDDDTSNGRTRAVTLLLAAVALTVLVGSFAAPVTAQTNVGETGLSSTGETVYAQSNTTETPTPTPPETVTESACDPGDDEPQLSQSRLYAPQQTITSGEPGQIAGGFQVAADASCSVVVSITMSVPSGMSISGSSDVVSSGAGLATAEFTVDPGEIRDIRANVYSQNTGDRSVTADITYWPEGHQDMSRQIDGISLTFNVEEPITAENNDNGGTESTNESESGLLSNTTLLIFGAFALVILALVAVGTRS